MTASGARPEPEPLIEDIERLPSGNLWIKFPGRVLFKDTLCQYWLICGNSLYPSNDSRTRNTGRDFLNDEADGEKDALARLIGEITIVNIPVQWKVHTEDFEDALYRKLYEGPERTE